MEKVKLDPYFTLYTTINSRWFRGLQKTKLQNKIQENVFVTY